MQEVTWTLTSGGAPAGKKLDNPGTYKTFAKLSIEEQEKIFNAMRAELMVSGRMDSK